MHRTGEIHSLRDPTRGGLATTLNEFAAQSCVGIQFTESNLPVNPAVAGACELLGLDPLYVANEGKMVAAVAAADANRILARMKETRYGHDANDYRRSHWRTSRTGNHENTSGVIPRGRPSGR